MKIPRLVVASKNPDKIAEVEAVLADAGAVDEIVGGLDWPDVVEDGTTLAENALLKARAVSAATGLPAVADDTGLFVRALDDRPGVHSARFAGPDATYGDNVRLLLRSMVGRDDTYAEFRTVVALVWPDRPDRLTAIGVLPGQIIDAPRGDGGFGYDPVFELDGRTLAEVPIAEKNRISHRAQALRQLVELLLNHR